jgi:uncharacterized membrane protein
MHDTPHSTARIGSHPIHPMLITMPVTFFIGALLSDLAYWGNGELFWSTASRWLLGAGLATAALAAAAGLTDFLGDRRIRAISAAWQHLFANLALVALQLVNLVLRLDRGADVVVPTGLVLSAIGVAILAFSGWKGATMVYDHGVGVSDHAGEAHAAHASAVDSRVR